MASIETSDGRTGAKRAALWRADEGASSKPSVHSHPLGGFDADDNGSDAEDVQIAAIPPLHPIMPGQGNPPAAQPEVIEAGAEVIPAAHHPHALQGVVNHDDPVVNIVNINGDNIVNNYLGNQDPEQPGRVPVVFRPNKYGYMLMAGMLAVTGVAMLGAWFLARRQLHQSKAEAVNAMLYAFLGVAALCVGILGLGAVWEDLGVLLGLLRPRRA